MLVDGTNGGSLNIVAQACPEANPEEGAIYVGYGGSGTLAISNGGHVTSRAGYVATLLNQAGPASNGGVKVEDADSTWTISGPCTGQLIISGANANPNSGGTALLEA